MSSDAARSDLIYVSSYSGGSVTVYSYQTKMVVGEIMGFSEPLGLCTDPQQNVYVANVYGYDLIEYRHGSTKPIRYIPDINGVPWGCAFNPVNGDLAVVDGVAGGNNAEGVLIYKHGRGLPKFYRDGDMPYYFFCAYDSHGNLFIDGLKPSADTATFIELPAHRQALRTLQVAQPLKWPGGVVWDGKYVAIADPEAGVFYRFSVAHGRATVADTVALGGTNGPGEFVLRGGTALVTTGNGNVVYSYHYPRGGSPFGTFTSTDGGGIALSTATHE